MLLTNILNSIRIELQDQTSAIYEDDELIRAVEKTVSLMTRLLPQRAILDITIKNTFEQEAIPTSVYAGDAWIKTSTGDIYYAYAAGVSTVGATAWVLDNTFVPMFTAANSNMLYINSVLKSVDYIKIERIEFPIDQNPITLSTFDMVGDWILFRQKQTFTAGDKVRVIYLKKWTPPSTLAEGDYPKHLDDPIIIGSAGQALIFKAEKYVQSARTAADLIVTTLAGLTDITAPSFTATIPDVVTLTMPTAPTAYTLVKPSAPSITGVTAVPTIPTPDFTAVSTALGLIDTWLTYARNGSTGYMDTGAALINAATRGDNVGVTYGKYADSVINVAAIYANKAEVLIKQLETALLEWQLEVAAYQSYTSGYSANLQATVSKYEGEIQSENAAATVLTANSNLYRAGIEAELTKLQNYQAKVQAFQAQVNQYQIDVQSYIAQINKLTTYSQLLGATVTNFLDIAGRYLASGQSKINEFAAMLGVKLEFYTQRAASEQR